MTDETTNDNVFKIVGGSDKPPVADLIDQNEYLIIDRKGNEHYVEGFLLFTSQHVAVMRESGAGAIPVFVMPLDMVFSASLLEDDEVFDEDVVYDSEID